MVSLNGKSFDFLDSAKAINLKALLALLHSVALDFAPKDGTYTFFRLGRFEAL